MSEIEKYLERRREEEYRKLRRISNINNPNNEPTGHYTGRCGQCGSNDLWTDGLTYGCNSCHFVYIGN